MPDACRCLENGAVRKDRGGLPPCPSPCPQPHQNPPQAPSPPGDRQPGAWYMKLVSHQSRAHKRKCAQTMRTRLSMRLSMRAQPDPVG